MKKTIILLFLFFLNVVTQTVVASKIAVQLNVNQWVGPATEQYVSRGLSQAQQMHATLVVLQLDTSGGSNRSILSVMKSILSSTIPVVAYVGPRGAQAKNAGALILYAAHLAAMAPETSLGTLTSASALPSILKEIVKKSTPDSVNTFRASQTAMSHLALHRNIKWAEQSVMGGQYFSAHQALHHHLIDVIAPDVHSLLNDLNGMKVNVGHRVVVLNTKNINVFYYQADRYVNFLKVITKPLVIYLFLIIAFYGIFIEFSHPGLLLPALIGLIALGLGLYGLHGLPINYTGLSLLFLGFILFIAEIFVSSFGLFLLGGLICFIIGSSLFINTDGMAFMISWSTILMVSAVTVLFVFFLLQLVMRARNRPPASGLATLLGQSGEVFFDGNKAWLRIQGELWRIKNKDGLKTGDRVTVTEVKGLTVTIKK